MAFNGTEGGQISLEVAAELTSNYRTENPTSRIAHFFGRDILLELLNQDGCVGLRMYYGIGDDGEKELVVVGVDSDENDILDIVADRSMPCPKACSSANPLNS